MGYAFDLVKLGVASRDANTNLTVVQAADPLTDEQDDVEHFGEIGMVQSLGLTSMPAPPSDEGSATGFIVRDVANTDGIIIGGYDARTSKDTFALGPGETCLHSTGKEFESRVFCKEKSVSLVIGNKAVLTLNEDSLQIAVAGNTLEMSESGIILTAKGGETWLVLANGASHLAGNTVALGTLAPAVTGSPMTGNGCAYGPLALTLASLSVSVAP